MILKTWAAPSEVWLQRQMEALAPHLDALVAPRPRTSSWNGVPVIDLLKPPTPPRWRRALRLPPRQTRLDPDAPLRVLRRAVARPTANAILVHFLDQALLYRAVWEETDKPLYVHCHGYDVTWDLRAQHRRFGIPVHDEAYRQAARELAQRAILIANSHCTAGRLREIGIPSDRIRVKYPGVEIPPEPPLHPPRITALKLLFLGRLVDCKGPDLTIDAFSRACAGGLDAGLLLAGDGHLRVTCELQRARSPAADRIELLGFVDRDRAAALRAEADIFTAHNCTGPLSHQEEAFGVGLAEAMASALPITTGRNGSVPELIEDGVHGLLFEPGDVAAHAEALLRLARDPALRRKLGEAGWERARERFSLERETAAFLRILGLGEPAEPRPDRGSRPGASAAHPPQREGAA